MFSNARNWKEPKAGADTAGAKSTPAAYAATDSTAADPRVSSRDGIVDRKSGPDPESIPVCLVPPPNAPPAGEEAAWQQAISRRRCLHCDGELGRAWREEDGPFCCQGCRTVYNLLHGTGLARYYDLRQGQQTPAARLRSDSFAWLDRLLAEREDETGPLQLSLDIQGVHCAACVWLLEELFRREEGGLDLRINPTLGKVDLTWDSTRGDLKYYLTEVEKFGYRLGPSLKDAPLASRRLLARMAVCIAAALNVMMFSLSYYFGLAPTDGALYTFFGYLSLLLATLAVIVGGQVFFKSALASLRRRVTHLDLPIALGMGLAYLGSVYSFLISGPEAAYFDSLTVFVALMLVGRWAQEHILERNRNSLLATTGVDQLTAKCLRDGKLLPVAATDIRLGDELWIAPGDLTPVAGVLLRKAAEASLDWITGESGQRAFGPGDQLPAGAFNAGHIGFALTATEDFASSRLNELLRLGAPARDNQGFRPHWWSRVSTGYVVAVLGLAGAGFLAWFSRDPRQALEVAVAILVVTCPCALGLATPLAQELIQHALRRRGVFLRKGTFLDKALAVRKLLLDKTGTLTMGCLVLDPESRRELWRLSGADKLRLQEMTSRSNHPVSRCLSQALGVAPDLAVRPGGGPLGEGLLEIPGRGLEWRWDGHVYRLGRAEFALSRENHAGPGTALPGNSGEPATVPTLSAHDAGAETIFALDGRSLGRFRFREEYKADAAEELAGLQASGYEIHLLSGDAPAKVRAAAEALGIPAENALGRLDPEQKAERVRALDRQDSLMVGDGINDSPSFEAALCSATPAVDRPVLPGKADFYFLGDGIAALRRSLMAARCLRQVVKQNLVLAVLYNTIAVGLCFAGLVEPVVAAILMPLSSISIVSWTAYRLSGRRLSWMS